MSDTTPETKAASAEDAAPIDFERAEFAEPAAEQLQCATCQQPIATEYWQCLGKILCDSCREGVERAASDARRGATMGRAVLVGGGAALACGIGYAVFVGVTHIHFALVTIGIGWAVGRAIQHVTRGFGSRKHQVLAVALTYFASSMGYYPAVLKAIGGSGSADKAAVVSTSAPSAQPSSAQPSAGQPSAQETPAPVKPSDSNPGGGPGLAASLAIFIAFSVGIALAAPFLEITSGLSGLLGALIIFFGLRTAWRVAQGVEAPVTGPHKVTAES